MSVYLNPFHSRASEQHRDVHQFVATFGPGALDMLPGSIWDRLVLLRSSPGAGKTSLMRLFTPENLDWVRTRPTQNEAARKALVEIGAIDREAVAKLGVLINLDRDYRSLLDLPIEEEPARRLFLRLLDVRILVGVLRSALTLTGRPFPDAVDEVALDAKGDVRVEVLLERLGGTTGSSILEYSRLTERTILRLLDALLATDVDSIPDGHSELFSLSVLESSTILVAGRPVEAQPLLMFDDGHSLHRSQRDTLLDELRKRRSSVARWYAERFEALSDQELLQDVGEDGRDVAVVALDSIARDGSTDGKRFHRGKHDRVLSDIARRRAAHQLSTYAQEQREFLDLLDEDRDTSLEDVHREAVAELKHRVERLTGNDSRYDRWLDHPRSLSGFDATVAWRELEILIHRDQDRQHGLFDDVLPTTELIDRSNPAVHEGAGRSVATEFNLPYYAGAAAVVRLGSFNAHQFLGICGDLFAEMLVDVSLGRPPHLSVARQHRVLTRASENYWDAIPRTVPHGRDVQAIVQEIVSVSMQESQKPRMPYPPGVTGTALLMGERDLLLDADYRSVTPGAERLFEALAAAVAHNVISAELDYRVKGNNYMVLYLNRLLCPKFKLPLGYGSFREKRLKAMVGWMQKQPAHGRSTPIQEANAPWHPVDGRTTSSPSARMTHQKRFGRLQGRPPPLARGRCISLASGSTPDPLSASNSSSPCSTATHPL